MTAMSKRIFFALVALGCAAAVVIVVACGSSGGTGGDGGTDASTCWSNCTSSDGGDGGACTNLGSVCTSGGECCSGNCLNGACQPPPCTSDNQACSGNSECCSGTCGNGKCTPLNPSCKSLGNACTAGAECCSTFCENGICAQPSYCGQSGDTCQHNTDCCGGICTITQGNLYGTCAQPPQTGAQCSAVDGVVCFDSDGGTNDAGVPVCGGACCSRDCAPWGPTHVFICQPASGCHPVGDICYKNADCCGGLGTNPQEYCDQPDAGMAGTCHNPSGCKPNGDICRLQSMQCNATDNCCSGNVQQYDTCKQDNLGVPRCSYAGDAGCTPSNGTCATSADCCNLNPCVPDQDGGLTCYPSNCVPTNGACTTDADCCVGGHCYIQGGQTSGTCQPLTGGDGGTPTDAGGGDSAPPPCALYGQTCSTSSDCCDGVPCTMGRCEYPVY